MVKNVGKHGFKGITATAFPDIWDQNPEDNDIVENLFKLETAPK